MMLSGVFAPIPTPFDNEGGVDIARLRAALRTWLATRLTGIVVLGSSGEAPLLDEQESDAVIAAARDAIPRDRPLIAGAGRESTRATIQAATRAGTLGVDAVLVRTPGFFKHQMTTDALVDHFRAVADACPVPVILYNFTALTGVTLDPAAAAELANHPNIIGMKESGGDVARIRDLVAAVPDRFRVLAGSGSAFYPSLCAGASGGVLALACVVWDACVRIYDLTVGGRHDEARTIQEQVAALAQILGGHGVPALKAAVQLAGIDAGPPRPPLMPFPERGTKELATAFARFQEVLA